MLNLDTIQSKSSWGHFEVTCDGEEAATPISEQDVIADIVGIFDAVQSAEHPTAHPAFIPPVYDGHRCPISFSGGRCRRSSSRCGSSSSSSSS